MILVVLQSAYARSALARGYHYGRWLREFLQSRTGRRLALVFGAGLPGVRWRNCSPVVTATAAEMPPPSRAHLRRALARVRPNLVVACGRVAEQLCCALWPGELLVLPHPASRVLTNRLLWRASRVVTTAATGAIGRLALRQRRGRYVCERLAAWPASQGRPETPP